MKRNDKNYIHLCTIHHISTIITHYIRLSLELKSSRTKSWHGQIMANLQAHVTVSKVSCRSLALPKWMRAAGGILRLRQGMSFERTRKGPPKLSTTRNVLWLRWNRYESIGEHSVTCRLSMSKWLKWNLRKGARPLWTLRKRIACVSDLTPRNAVPTEPKPKWTRRDSSPMPMQ